MRYSSPKAGLTFKRVFDEHLDLMMSFLNTLLPLRLGESIIDTEYLPSGTVSENSLPENSIACAHRRDSKRHSFVVEIQVIWSPKFK